MIHKLTNDSVRNLPRGRRGMRSTRQRPAQRCPRPLSPRSGRRLPYFPYPVAAGPVSAAPHARQGRRADARRGPQEGPQGDGRHRRWPRPIATKAKSRADGKLIFETVAREYLEARARDLKPGSLDQCTRHLLKYLKGLHRLAIGKIDKATIAVELRAIAKKSGPVQADRARSTLSAMLGWCVRDGLLEANPAANTNRLSNAKSRERVLTDDELVAVWNAAPDFGLRPDRQAAAADRPAPRRDCRLAGGRNRG